MAESTEIAEVRRVVSDVMRRLGSINEHLDRAETALESMTRARQLLEGFQATDRKVISALTAAAEHARAELNALDGNAGALAAAEKITAALKLIGVNGDEEA